LRRISNFSHGPVKCFRKTHSYNIFSLQPCILSLEYCFCDFRSGPPVHQRWVLVPLFSNNLYCIKTLNTRCVRILRGSVTTIKVVRDRNIFICKDIFIQSPRISVQFYSSATIAGRPWRTSLRRWLCWPLPVTRWSWGFPRPDWSRPSPLSCYKSRKGPSAADRTQKENC
jgi:hypothetical protein